MKIRSKLWVSNFRFFHNFQNFETNAYQNHQNPWYFGWSHVLEGQDLDFLVKKQSWNLKKNRIEKFGTNFGSQNLHVELQVPKIRKMRIQKWPNCMIFWLIACFRRSGSRISGQKAVPRANKEKNEYENHQNPWSLGPSHV